MVSCHTTNSLTFSSFFFHPMLRWAFVFVVFCSVFSDQTLKRRRLSCYVLVDGEEFCFSIAASRGRLSCVAFQEIKSQENRKLKTTTKKRKRKRGGGRERD